MKEEVLLHRSGGVLYIHPHNHLSTESIAAGTIAAINSLPGKALGRHAEEVSPEEVAAAKVILLDVHYFFPLGILAGLLANVRRINPQAHVVLGGITAAFFAPEIVERFGVDYVVGGDAEATLPVLMEHLLSDRQPPTLADVWRRGGGEPPRGRSVGAEALDRSDWLTIDWFPTFRRRILGIHKRYRDIKAGGSDLERFRIRANNYPALIPVRGCRRRCDQCFGTYQDAVFGKGVAVCSPGKVMRDLEKIAGDPDLEFVQMFFGDCDLMKSFASAFTDRGLGLDAHLWFCGTASKDTLERIHSAFTGHVTFMFVQTTDLAPVQGDPDRETQAAQYGRMLENLRSMEDTDAKAYHYDGDPHATALRACRGATNIELVRHRWMRSPFNPSLPPAGSVGSEQDQRLKALDAVVTHAKELAGFHLVRKLVPALQPALEMGDSIETQPDELAARGFDDIERRVIDAMVARQIQDQLLGFEDVTLRWRVRPEFRDGQESWTVPGDPAGGWCEWDGDLCGLRWRGEVVLANSASVGLSPSPEISVKGKPPIELGNWEKAILPIVPVKEGPQRTVAAGGRITGTGVTCWVEDRGERKEYFMGSGPN